MRLARFRTQENERNCIGLVNDDAVIDITAAIPSLPVDMVDLLEEWDVWSVRIAAVDGRAPSHDLSEVELLAPIARPRKVLGIGLNYPAHAAEGGAKVPDVQHWFNKQSTCINGPYAPVHLPAVSTQLDYEGELVAVIGRRARHVSRERALDHVAGYMVGDDVSVRDWQLRSPTTTVGKSFDTHGPIGPWITTSDEVPDPGTLQLSTYVNGEQRQAASTGEMVFSIPKMIEYLSTAFTLEPGDLLFTGTPEGVGLLMKPPRFLTVGDRVRVEIEGLGAIENEVVAEPIESTAPVNDARRSVLQNER
jgi:2-keto-4-pentenoate hydratase/2-oxohepta-3-ene-1,7-dioic acid hydratase in catechol pathway